jgi:hypothetical protein
VSPSFTSQRSIVPSVTDSPSWGILIVVAMSGAPVSLPNRDVVDVSRSEGPIPPPGQAELSVSEPLNAVGGRRGVA